MNAALPLLSVDSIHTFYGETQVLFGASLQVRPGEVLALLGPNGAGKTTTLRSILGLTPARRGAISFDGRTITHEPTHRIAALGVGWVPDDRRVFPTLTVARNLEIARKKTRFRAWSFGECFALFSALEYLLPRECENLSGGEMQMVAIARVLLGAPGLVLLDEPSQGLAPKVVQDVMRAVERLRGEGAAVLLVEQNASMALSIAGHGYVMEVGKLVLDKPAAVLAEDEDVREFYLGLHKGGHARSFRDVKHYRRRKRWLS
jgi:branched-chain amino acid transport system ATP-binding protein